MHRVRIAAAALCILALAGCSQDYSTAPATRSERPPSAPMPMSEIGQPAGRADSAGVLGKPMQQQQQLMAYSHTMWLISGPSTVQAHFERARDRCLNDAALNCVLVSGAANAGDEMANDPPSAQLVVSLPHEQVAPFQKGLLAALPGKGASDITVRQQTVEAENVTQVSTDIDRRIAQLTGYRDRLSVIAERSNVKAADLIELEEKISEIQSELDALAAQKTSLGERVHRERVAVTFGAKATIVETQRPLAQAWDSSFEILGQSASAVLILLVTIVPWLPIAGLIWLVVWLVRRNKRQRAVAAPPPAQTVAAGGS